MITILVQPNMTFVIYVNYHFHKGSQNRYLNRKIIRIYDFT